MRFQEEALPYLRGEKYTNALSVDFTFDEEDFSYRTQIDLLCELAEGKKVIHLGCADHNKETIIHKIKRKKWLHGRLCQTAERCHGVDIDEESILFIQKKYGYNDTSSNDIFSYRFRKISEEENWDYLMIPEVLEHIDNPGEFLSRIVDEYRGCFKKMVLTVPNGLAHDNWKLAKKGVETINSDHRFWFTPYTISRAIVNAGLHLEKILMCRHGSINWRAFRRNRFYKKHPLLRNDILCIADFG